MGEVVMNRFVKTLFDRRGSQPIVYKTHAEGSSTSESLR